MRECPHGLAVQPFTGARKTRRVEARTGARPAGRTVRPWGRRWGGPAGRQPDVSLELGYWPILALACFDPQWPKSENSNGPFLKCAADHTTNERHRVSLRPPIEAGEWSLVRQETNMTNLGNETRELTIDELDAVNGGKGDGKGDGGGGGKGTGAGTGGGDGLGWLRTILRTIL
jgi:hypothetical protein